MEDKSSLIPSFARRLSILLVDHDTTSLMCLSSMLEQFTFKVTTAELASIALSMVEEQKGRFRLVMANANLPDMESLEFLHVLLDKNIPVILMSSQTSANAARKAIAEGASFFLNKPISTDDLKYVWQHAYKNKINATIHQNQNTIYQEKDNIDALIHKNCIEVLQNVESMKRSSEDDNDELINREKRVKTMSEEENYTWKETALEEMGQKSSSHRKSRILWTPDLHLKFTAAISALGDKKARPKPILEMMNVPHLTQRQVASHLQKYKSQVRRICETGTTNLPAVGRSSGFCGRTRILDAFDKNISASAVGPPGGQSSEFGIRDLLQLPKSLLNGVGTPNMTSSCSSLGQGSGASSSGSIQELLDSLARKLTPGNESCAENQKMDLVEISVPSSGNESRLDKFTSDFIDADQETYSMQISNNYNSVNLPDTEMFPEGFFNDFNQEFDDAMKIFNSCDQESHNLDKILTGSSDLNQELDTSRNVSNATAVSDPLANQSQTWSKYADLWNMMEDGEDDDGFKYLAGEANSGDVDRYCDLLTDVLLGKS